MDELYCDDPFWVPFHDLEVNSSNDSIVSSLTPFRQCFEDTILVWIPCGYLLLIAPFYIFYLSTVKSIGSSTYLNISKTVISACLVLICIVDLGYRIRDVHQYAWPAGVIAGCLQIAAMATSIVLIQIGRRRAIHSTGVMFIYWLLQLVSATIILQSRARGVGVDSVFYLAFICVFDCLVFIQLILASLFDNCGIAELDKDAKACPEGKASFLSVITFWWFTSVVVKGFRKPLTRDDLWSLNPDDTSQSVFPLFKKHWERELVKSRRSHEVVKSESESARLIDESVQLTSLKRLDDEKKLPIDDAEEVKPLNQGAADVEDVKVGEKDCLNENGVKASADSTVPKGQTEEVLMKSSKKAYQPKLWLALARTFWAPFATASMFKLVHDILMFVSPVLLKWLIGFVSKRSEILWHGYAFAVLMFINAFVQSMFLHQYFHRCMVVGMRIRTALISAVYRKSLILSNAARKKSTVGEIVNLMAVDAQRFMELTTYLNMLWSAPFQMIVSLVFLWMILGPSILAGVGVMVLMIPINAVIAKKSRSLQVQQMKHKDSRIKLMSEILDGIKVLKLYAWEIPFQNKVSEIRNEELLVLKKAAYLHAGSSFTWTCSPFLVALVTFAVYVLSSPDNVLDAEKTFVSLTLFNILRFPLAMLPMLIANLVQTSVSVKRLQNFLNNEELECDSVEHDAETDLAIEVKNGTFTWDRSEGKTTLSDIDLKIKPGSFVGVVGQVGCGKSSLLSAMLGETDKVAGSVSVKGSVAYVAQQPWIQNATIKDGILFGKPMNEAAYHKVIEACALEADLKEFEGGDLTEIGEKGINLSGGQKLRVSLARAVYSNRDVYLLDDPLSAVDAHVGRHIFDQVFGNNGLLKNKTRVMVTHGISFLPQLDQIIVMVDGRISEVGTYRELLDRKGAFAEFLYNYLESEPAEETDTDTQQREEILSKIGTERRSLSGSANNVSSASPSKTQRSISTIDKDHPDGVSRSRHSLHRHASKDSGGGDAARTVKDPEKELLKKKEADKKKLIQDEKVEKGSVKLSVFLVYLKSIGYHVSLLITLFYILNNAASVYASIWLSQWSEDIGRLAKASVSLPNNGLNSSYGSGGAYPVDTVTNVAFNGADSVTSSSYNTDRMTVYDDQRNLRLGVYAALGLAQGLAVLFAAFVLAVGSVRSSKILHEDILENGLRAPMQFFDSTPTGRIINRFSKDVDVVDNQLPRSFQTCITCCLAVVSTLFVIGFSTPWFLITVIPMAIIYYLVQRFYVATSRQLRRLESVSRSPIYSHFGETVQGVSTIRAFREQDRFIHESDHRVDENQLCYYPGIASNRWLAVRLEFVGNCLVLFAALFAVIGREHLSGGIVGLSVSYALNITQTLNWLVRMTSELETNIVAVERIREYASETEPEADWVIKDNRPEEGWPTQGLVQLTSYSTRYRKDLDPVVKEMSLEIKGGEKVGIVGRTGSGKTSLTLGLFRIIEPCNGNITIDGINVSEIGLHDLRSKLTIIPQDPVMFSGSLRFNLDPFNAYKDDQIWRALELAQLKRTVEEFAGQLEYKCAESGKNFSVGQRQLVCLARAILRKTRILILDEATSSVDLETDDIIQKTIRREFADSTFITIAHRLNTVMDYDRILVLDNGRIVEFDTPRNLLSNKSGQFYSLAAEANLVSSE